MGAGKPYGVSVKGLVQDGQGRLLLIKRSVASKHNAGLWDLPGGKCDPGESMDAALEREIHEETGLGVRSGKVVSFSQWEIDPMVVVYLFLEAGTGRTDVTLSPEHDEFRWVTARDLGTLKVVPQFRDILQKYMKGVGSPAVAQSRQWYKDRIDQYRGLRPDYTRMADTLNRVLDTAAKNMGFLAIVQARAKAIDSFAEKILRKGYEDPFRQMTDLCGARVIVHTPSEVAAVSRYIEDHFTVYKEDSGNKEEVLRDTEFGYLSYHFIVSLKPDSGLKDVPSDLVEKGLKAEIQVRTIVQHAWADMVHDLSYKNSFKLPRKWNRAFSRLAAVLEDTDKGFEDIKDGMKQYAASYGTYMTPEQLQAEIERFTVVLEADPGNEAIAQRLAKMCISKEDWARAVAVLRPFAEKGAAQTLRDLGISLCKLRRKETGHPEFAEGQSFIEKAMVLNPMDVDACASLGGTWRAKAKTEKDPSVKKGYRMKAKECYKAAYEKDPGDPYPLGNYISYLLADDPKLDVGSYFKPSLEAASRRCLAHVEVGVNIPWAYFDLGKYHLLLREPEKAMGYYAMGVAKSSAPFYIESALSDFEDLQSARERIPRFDEVRDFLEIARSYRFGEAPEARGGNGREIQAPVVILAGYCDQPAKPEHRDLLVDGLKDMEGTLVSGGTVRGIPAVAGELQAMRGWKVRTIGYVPEDLPSDVKTDARYSEIRKVAGQEGFSFLEPLQYWKDIVAAGVGAKQVLLVCVGGGGISGIERCMAAALGARVAVIDVKVSEGDACRGVESPSDLCEMVQNIHATAPGWK